jgi:DNA modification methylase
MAGVLIRSILNGRCTIHIGDCMDAMRAMQANSVDCVVTSPPYWGLRDYGVDGQIGMESTLGEHIQVMVEVFREVRRILKPHGTFWLNYGDSYAAQPNGRSAADVKAIGNDDRTFRDKPFSTIGPILQPDARGPQRLGAKEAYRPDSGATIRPGGYLKPKDLCMIPNRLAIALQDDGWWVRSEIIWHKPNPMPESVYDRPTVAHEKIWLLTKGEDYFYDQEAIREPVSQNTHARLSQDLQKQLGSVRANGGTRPDRPMKAVGKNSRENVDRVPRSRKGDTGVGWGRLDRTCAKDEDRGRDRVVTKMAGENEKLIKSNKRFAEGTALHVDTRNSRNVWTIAPKAFREAHFATFPPALAERCIKAGVPKTVCGCCGAPSGCGPICEIFGRVPGKVFDPFGGAGTVSLVAEQLGVDSAMVELNPDYAEIAIARIEAALQPKIAKRKR